jgi:hypothetical protein
MAEHPADWVVVASYQGTSADIDADVAVSVLKGSHIPALRLPVEPMVNLSRGMLAATEPVQVLVPAEHASEARALLKQRDTTPPEVKARVDALAGSALRRIAMIAGFMALVFGLMYLLDHGCSGGG